MMLNNHKYQPRNKDIDAEIRNYQEYFKDKVVLCNFDDPQTSNFYLYFKNNFEKLGLKKLILTYFSGEPTSLKLECYDSTGRQDKITSINNSGNYDRESSLAALDEADIVVTMPWGDDLGGLLQLLIAKNKKFILLADYYSLYRQNIALNIRRDDMWLGYNVNKRLNLEIVDGNIEDMSGCVLIDNRYHVLSNALTWYTNLPTQARSRKLPLTKSINDIKYRKYDNANAIDISELADIPYDYPKHMGVPISFLRHYNPEQFKIVSFGIGQNHKRLRINGEAGDYRIIIRYRK